jgi:hypothetical protein
MLVSDWDGSKHQHLETSFCPFSQDYSCTCSRLHKSWEQFHIRPGARGFGANTDTDKTVINLVVIK